ncbi:MAG: rod shape-determining protein RodA [Syntrophobacterales bacterium]|nr:MAG: rod shape-determining protein RodA [Syntrophobacterales bacterium]
MIDRRLLAHFDWPLLILVLIISFIGVFNLYSATFGEVESYLYAKQILWMGIGLALTLFITVFDYRLYRDFAYIFYGISLVLLMAVFIYSIIHPEVSRWIKVGPLCLQPAELVKITIILSLAKYFDRFSKRDGYLLRDLFIPFIILLLPSLMVAKQPDLGTAISILLIGFSIFLFVKIKWKSLVIMIIGGISILPFMWNFLMPYQKRRILTFFRPELDPLGAGYHIIQSKIAIGSGGFLGKGFLKGTQCKLHFIPAQHTDFVFSVLAEEWGLLGGLILLGLYLFFILWGLNISVRSKDRFGTIVAFGVVSMIFWHIIINIGMALGIMPVVGIPLPFMSYGGSAIISMMAGVGLLLNISMRRYIF